MRIPRHWDKDSTSNVLECFKKLHIKEEAIQQRESSGVHFPTSGMVRLPSSISFLKQQVDDLVKTSNNIPTQTSSIWQFRKDNSVKFVD